CPRLTGSASMRAFSFRPGTDSRSTNNVCVLARARFARASNDTCPIGSVASTTVPFAVSSSANDSPRSTRPPPVDCSDPSRRTRAETSCARERSCWSSDPLRSDATWAYTSQPAPARTSAIASANTSVKRSLSGSRVISVAFRPQPIADAAHRLDRVRAERSVDLLPQIANVDVDDVGTILVGEVPGVLEQLESSENLAWATHEGLQECELLRREVDLLLAAPATA